MNKEILDKFFNKTLENVYNEEMLNRGYVFPINEIKKYINELCNISINEYIDYIISLNDVEQVLPKNIFQFSSFDDCTINLCNALIKNGDEGYRFDDIGRLLLDDGKERKIGALRKYGENATKTASELGLIQIIENYSFLSCIGYAYPSLSEDIKQKITTRLILRSLFFVNLIRAARNDEYDIHWLLMSLGESTQRRRISNIKFLIKYLKCDDSDELNRIIDNVKFD